MSKVLPLGLLTSTTTSYDQTKTTLQGRAAVRTITDGNGAKSTVGPSPVVTGDVFDDTGVAPTTIHTSTTNGRIFIGKGLATNVWTLSYYTLDTTTGVEAWQGDLKLTFGAAAVTYTIKGFHVDDSNPASMKIFWVATHTTATNGGLFGCWGVNVTDFVKVSVATFPIATAANQTKATFQLGDNVLQASQTLTVSDGVGYDSVGGFAYVLNGAAATPSIFKFSASSPPAVVPAANGYDSTLFSLKTGTLTALAGTILLVNNVQVMTPGSWSSNSGSACLSFLTTTTMYHAKLTDITSGVTTLPSLASGNTSISSDYVSPAAIALGQYSSVLDKYVLLLVVASSSRCIVKQGINNDPNGKVFGLPDLIKSEAGGTITPDAFGGTTAVCLTMCNGWAVLTMSGTGQRGFEALDLYSDESSTTSGQINTSVISPVVSGNFSQGIAMGLMYELAKRSVKPTIQYRTSNFTTGPGVGFDATWTTVPKDGDLSTIVNSTQVQFRFLYTMMGNEVTNPPMLSEAYFIYKDLTQTSSNWEGSVDNTTQAGASPARTAFRLKTAYSTSVPTVYFRAYDDSGSLVASANTSSNPTSFEYSSNNGTSWNALGTIPNVALTTELRYNWTSPPGVRVTCSLSES